MLKSNAFNNVFSLFYKIKSISFEERLKYKNLFVYFEENVQVLLNRRLKKLRRERRVEFVKGDDLTAYKNDSRQAKILVVVERPDDETLGAGATIRKFTDEGRKINLCVMSSEAKARTRRLIDGAVVNS